MTAAQQDYKELQAARRNREDLSVLLELRDIDLPHPVLSKYLTILLMTVSC
jgi:hypothetical protein